MAGKSITQKNIEAHPVSGRFVPVSEIGLKSRISGGPGRLKDTRHYRRTP